MIGNPNFQSHFCWIDINNQLAGELAARHLLERGCQEVAFIGGKQEDKISMHRLNGVIAVLKSMMCCFRENLYRRGSLIVKAATG